MKEGPQPTPQEVDFPLALKNLIIANNQLLRNFQLELRQQVEEASQQMMLILNLNPAEGWKLDVQNMRFSRPLNEEELVKQQSE